MRTIKSGTLKLFGKVNLAILIADGLSRNMLSNGAHIAKFFAWKLLTLASAPASTIGMSFMSPDLL